MNTFLYNLINQPAVAVYTAGLGAPHNPNPPMGGGPPAADCVVMQQFIGGKEKKMINNIF